MQSPLWSAGQSPVSDLPDPRRFDPSDGQREALARLHYLVDHGRRVAMLTGPAGSGKSLLLRVLQRELRRAGHEVVLVNPTGADAGQFLWELAAQLGTNPQPGDSAGRSWRRIADRLTEHRCQQRRTVVLVDDADRAEGDVLAQIARLAVHDPDRAAQLTLVLAAEAGRREWLGRRLLDRAALRIELGPWDAQEVGRYVRSLADEAGESAPKFSAEAAQRLCQAAEGAPRRVAQLAELALLAAAEEGADQVAPESVDQIRQELLAP